MRSDLQKVRQYFLRFGYEPSVEEIFTYFPQKMSKTKLVDYIDKTRKDTLGEYQKKSEIRNMKSEISLAKIRRVQKYLDFISRFPQIKLLGLSGSVAMLNAGRDDDVDLFIVSSENRLWTSRFLTNTMALLFGLKRKRGHLRAKDKVCLNLFFSESHLKIAKRLRSEYMAHEVLQMIPILDVNKTYRKFLYENDWILAFFPNVRLNSYLPDNQSFLRSVSKNRSILSLGVVGDIFEKVCKSFQLFYMSEPKGEERVEEGQLWFHPRDYSRIVKSKV